MKNKFNTLSISIASVIGIVIYQFLKYIKYEKIDISMLVGYLLGTVLFLIFFYIKFKKNKSNKLPDYDERHKEIINNFVKNMDISIPLKNLTDNVHYHTISTKNEESFENIKKALAKKGYLK